MSNLRNTAARAALLSALRDEVDAELKAVKQDLAAGLAAERKATGTSQIAAEVDGEAVATIAWVTPDPVATVIDEPAFRAWVQQHHPDQVQREFTTTVRPAFVKALLGELIAAGTPTWCDKSSGELHEVPGVQFIGRTPHTRMTFRKVDGRETGRQAIAEAWRSGRLVLPGSPAQLEGGE